jgi:hypothetical protein
MPLNRAKTIYGIPGGALPKVKVTSVNSTSFTFTTVKGHFEAGTITFSATDTGSGFIFRINSVAKSSSWGNVVFYNYIGRQVQTATWRNFLSNVKGYGEAYSYH